MPKYIFKFNKRKVIGDEREIPHNQLRRPLYSIGWQSMFAEPNIVLIREGRGKKQKTQRKRRGNN
jgi:hypothetical protein